MGQKITVISKRNKDEYPKGIAVRKSSIGYIWFNNQRYGYNIDKLATNRIDFDQINARTEPRRTIFVRRK
jgi:hypothetical protein